MGTLIDFDALTDEELSEIDVTPASAKGRSVQRHVVTPQVSVQVSVTPVQRESKPSTHLLAGQQQWDWRQLRDYVIEQIEAIHGPQPRDPRKEKSIFSGFINRWGAQAHLIAKAAFEVHQGMWKSAPISVNRFCRASDEYFASVIAERL